MKKHLAPGALAVLAALAYAAPALAHAVVSPPVALAKHGQVFTLAVPTERAGATTATVVLTPPPGLAIDSFFPAPGWKRTVARTGSGGRAAVATVTWTGGAVPSGEDAAFSFVASPSGSGSYTFAVRQTYSDGTVVDWSGPESSDTPAPVVRSVSSLAGASTSTLSIVALAAAAAAGLVALGALLARSGRPLT